MREGVGSQLFMKYQTEVIYVNLDLRDKAAISFNECYQCVCMCVQVCSRIRFKLKQYIQMRLLPVTLVQLKDSLRQAHNSVHLEVCVCVCPI